MALLAAGSWNGNVMSAFSQNRRRILSLWLPRLPIDRIKRQLACSTAALVENSQNMDGRLSPPLWGRAGEGGSHELRRLPPPPSLTLPHKGGGNNSAREAPSIVVARQ